MLRTEYKNISVVFTSLGVLCLWLCLMLSLRLAPTHAQPQRQSASAPRQPPYYAVDSFQKPGMVYRIVNGKPSIFFRRRSDSISCIALWGGQLYFCSANDRKIYQRMGQRERVVFEHTSTVRDVAVDPKGNLYFSEASGPKGDGRIYQLTPSVSSANKLKDDGRFSIATDSQSRPVQVRLSTVDKFWEGDFTFDEQSNLYLCSGNHIPAFIYRVPKDPNGVYGRPQRVYKDSRGAIKGIAIEPNVRDPNNPDFICYADWGRSIFRLRIDNLRRSVAFSGSFSVSGKVAKSRNQHLSDIAFDIRSP